MEILTIIRFSVKSKFLKLTLKVLSFLVAEVDDVIAFGDDDDFGDVLVGLDIGDSDAITLAARGSNSRNGFPDVAL